MNKNNAQSIRAKLLNISKRNKQDFNYIVIRYLGERLLYRISQSRYANQFVLKGATLFKIWQGNIHRPTKDLDFLSYGTNEVSALEEIFKEVCHQECDDGVIFDAKSIKGEKIKEDQEYEGVRLLLLGFVHEARQQIQIDVGFGDVIIPEAIETEIKSDFTDVDVPTPRLKIYPRETVVSEKFQAMVKLGIKNSRMKDFYDVWYLSQNFEFDGNTLKQAFIQTFKRRKTKLPQEIPFAFTDEFIAEKSKNWQGFLKKNKIQPQSLQEIIKLIKKFLMPPCLAATNDQTFEKLWDFNSSQWQQKKV